MILQREEPNTIGTIKALFERLYVAKNNGQVREVEVALSTLQKTPEFVPSLIKIMCQEESINLKKSAATSIRKLISRMRSVQLQEKIQIVQLILEVLMCSASVLMKKIALRGAANIFDSKNDPQQRVHTIVFNKMRQQVRSLKQNFRPQPKYLQYLTLFGQLIVLAPKYELSLVYLLELFDTYILLLVTIIPFIRENPSDVNWISVLKENTLCLRMFFSNQVFLESFQFKKLLTSGDILLVLQQVLNVCSVQKSIMRQNDQPLDKMFNNSVCNCLAILYVLLKSIINFDKLDNVWTEAIIYSKMPMYLDLCLASLLNVRWAENLFNHRHLVNLGDEVLRLAAISCSIPQLNGYFYERKQKWLDIIFKLLQQSPQEIEQFQNNPEEYINYMEQLYSDKPDPSKLSEDEDILVAHMAMSMLLQNLCRYVDGIMSQLCRHAMAILIGTSPQDRSRLLAIKIICMVRLSATERKDFLRQLDAYIRDRQFTQPSSTIQSTSLCKVEMEACLHLMMIGVYIKDLIDQTDPQDLQPDNIHDKTLELILKVLKNQHPASKQNPTIYQANLYLIRSLFKLYTNRVIDVLEQILNHIRGGQPTIFHLLAIHELVSNCSNIHNNIPCLIRALNTVVTYLIKQLSIKQSLFAGKCIDIMVQLCCSSFLKSQAVDAIQRQLLPLLEYVKYPSNIDFSDEFVQILYNLLKKKRQIDQFFFGCSSILYLIAERNEWKLGVQLHLFNLYLVYSADGIVTILCQIVLRGMQKMVDDDMMDEQSKVEIIVLLQSISTEQRLHNKSLMVTIMAAAKNMLHVDTDHIVRQNLVAAMLVLATHSIGFVDQQEINKIIELCLAVEESIQDPYANRVYIYGLLKLLQYSDQPTLLRTTIRRLYLQYCYVRKMVPLDKIKISQPYSLMISRLQNVFTESDEFKTFIWITSRLQSKIKKMSQNISSQETEHMKLLLRVCSTDGGTRQIVKIKRS